MNSHQRASQNTGEGGSEGGNSKRAPVPQEVATGVVEQEAPSAGAVDRTLLKLESYWNQTLPIYGLTLFQDVAKLVGGELPVSTKKKDPRKSKLGKKFSVVTLSEFHAFAVEKGHPYRIDLIATYESSFSAEKSQQLVILRHGLPCPYMDDTSSVDGSEDNQKLLDLLEFLIPVLPLVEKHVVEEKIANAGKRKHKVRDLDVVVRYFAERVSEFYSITPSFVYNEMTKSNLAARLLNHYKESVRSDTPTTLLTVGSDETRDIVNFNTTSMQLGVTLCIISFKYSHSPTIIRLHDIRECVTSNTDVVGILRKRKFALERQELRAERGDTRGAHDSRALHELRDFYRKMYGWYHDLLDKLDDCHERIDQHVAAAKIQAAVVHLKLADCDQTFSADYLHSFDDEVEKLEIDMQRFVSELDAWLVNQHPPTFLH